ncbi:NAD-dependent protein deacetylase [Persicimonas caeni]|uniref:NAD-dependent protein deacetylase n=1 Tax=Persicimonas caeni TaxID=2292766 RepID=A0A4Y6PVJ9_PERCE|nr:NAD-dependent protein deacetylase [Persicimonas caeni]QED33606.1 NAD-dependent protein deacetylase [Persicimonas caeni]
MVGKQKETRAWLPGVESDLSELPALVDLLDELRVTVITGAGCSTESGIPDYRGPKTRQKTRNPIQYREFVTTEAARRRYWARSMVGWPRFRRAEPNEAHRAIRELEEAGVLRGVITQNVDRLHHQAGSRRVVELHGALAEVRCLECDAIEPRDDLQERLTRLNPEWGSRHATELAPDGDAELPTAIPDDFVIPACTQCSGVLKPNVVFFGENVPKPTVTDAWRLVDEADALLVVGSSLTVYSAFRFVRGAAKKRLPLGIVNLGETRGDEHAWVRVEARAGLVMPRLVEALG